jgi:alanine racemase
MSLARGAACVIFPAELQEVADAELPASVLKVSVEIPQDASWTDKDRMLCMAALRYLRADIAVTEPDRIFRPLRTRLDVSDGANNCLLIVDQFTCDLFSLDSALDFMARRRTAGRTSTLILDSLHSARSPQTYARLAEMLRERHIDRFIGVGAEFVENAAVLPQSAQLFGTAEEFAEKISVTDFSSELILAKGEAGGAVATLAETLQARHHETVLEVNLDAIIHNFNHYRAMIKPTTGLVAMVKASGYGAGSYELAKTLQSQGAAYLAVAVVDEGEELRRAGITMPIMALNPKVTDYDSLFANRLEPEVFSFDMLAEIISEGTKRGITHYPIHLKFDTGMHRLGFLQPDIPALAAMLCRQNVVQVRSVFSHLATADCLDMDQYTLEQLQLFSAICSELQAALPYKFLRHILNSAGIARFPEYQFDMVRLGIGLYGVDTLGIPQTRGLRTVSTLRTIIISIKEWDAGTAIGYSRRTVLDRHSRIATIPVGYADGLDRHLGNRHGEVLVNGARCPIVGNVCMDACMVDVTDAPGAKVGDSVEIFGENLPVDEVAQRLDTIPYEILTSVSPRVKRVYFRE